MHHITYLVAFYEGLELDFVFGALTHSSGYLAPLGLALHARDFKLAPSALVAVVGKKKISEASLTKTTYLEAYKGIKGVRK